MEEEKQISPQPQKKGKWALASLICGILLILAILLPNKIAISFPLIGTIKKIILNEGPLLTLIFGIIGLTKKENRAFSIFGVITGIIFIFLQFLPLLAVLLGIR